MSADHILTEQVFKAAEGIDLTEAEIGHLRGCADCREVLSVLTRHNRLRLQKLAVGSLRDHLPIAEIWGHARGSDIDGVYQNHLGKCDQCTDVLAFCRVSTSLRQVIQMLKDRGLKIE